MEDLQANSKITVTDYTCRLFSEDICTVELGKLKFELERANANTVRAREERDHVTSILDKREDKEAILRSELEIAQSENEKLIAKLDDLEGKPSFQPQIPSPNNTQIIHPIFQADMNTL